MVKDLKNYKGAAASSTSVFYSKEPRNTKFVFAEIVSYVLTRFTRDRDSISFVQVGSNDGVTSGDFIGRFFHDPKWQGLLIEPVPQTMARLRANFEGVEGLTFAQVAVWDSEGSRPFYWVQEDDGLSSFDLDTIMLHDKKFDDLAGSIEKIEVETAPLSVLEQRAGHATPDILAVDCEGADYVVLKTHDFDSHCPAICLFEHVLLDAEASAAIKAKLEGHGYTLVYDRHDVLCLHEDSFDADYRHFLKALVKQARLN